MKILFPVLFSFVFLQFVLQAQEPQKKSMYKNPVIPGDIPDPSIIRVGETYYSAGTTSDFAPHYSLYESADLINWKQIGFIFNEVPQWASDSFWAPELFYKDGIFYVYYTAKRKGDRVSCIGVATTKNIYNGFTDKGIIIEWGDEAIDAYVFNDDNGKYFISWKAYGLTEGRPIEILASELSPDCLSLVGEHFTLTDFDKGWKGAGDEGQCMVKHNGYYYLLYSIGGCCDNRCDYRVVVSRSKNFKSGWEQYPMPIMQGDDNWKCTGHGTLVTTPDNRYFYLYHSYNATDFEYIGRQGMLDELVWDNSTNWPYFKNGNTPSVIAPVPFVNTVQKRDTTCDDDFSSDMNLKFWQWDINQPKPEMAVKDGIFSLSSTQKGIVFVGQSPKTGTYSFETEIFECSDDLSGICVYGNKNNLFAFGASKSEIKVLQIIDGEETVISETKIPENSSVSLKLEVVNGRYYQFFWSENNTDWVSVKLQNGYQFDGEFLPQWGVAMRTGFFLENHNNNVAYFSSMAFKNNFKPQK